MHRALIVLFCSTVLSPAPVSAARAHRKPNQLLRVIEPAGRAVVSAHPFINVIVRFGTGTEGSADPAPTEGLAALGDPYRAAAAD